MEPLDRYWLLARGTTRRQFVEQVPSFFLLKRPGKQSVPASQPATMPFKTAFVRYETDPFARDWLVAPIQKRSGNPYPDRISIGRATNCDIVLRVHFISKVHAHILRMPDGSFALRDNQAVNATFLNGRALPPDSSRTLELGDIIAFGAMEFEFIDAGQLYDTVRREFGSCAPPP